MRDSPDWLLADVAFVTAAVSQHWSAIYYAEQSLRGDAGVIRAAIQGSKGGVHALQYVTESTRACCQYSVRAGSNFGTSHFY